MRSRSSAAALGLLLVAGCAKIFGVDDPGIASDGGAGQPCDLSSNDQTPCGPGFVCLQSNNRGQGSVCSPQCTADEQCPIGQGCLEVQQQNMGGGSLVLACAPNTPCNNCGNGQTTCMNGFCRNTCSVAGGSGGGGGMGTGTCPTDETCVPMCSMCNTGVCQPSGDGGGSGSGSGSSSGGDSGLPAPEIIASMRHGPSAIVVSSGAVFWTETGSPTGVFGCATSGCGGAPTPFPGFFGNPTDIAALTLGPTTAVAWADVQGFDIWMCTYSAGSGCTGATKLVTGLNMPFGVAIDGSSVYWTNVQGGSGGGIGSVGKCTPSAGDGGGNCPAMDMGAGSDANYPGLVLVSNGYVYWANASPASNGVSAARCPTSGCGSAPTPIAYGGMGIQGIAADASNFYFTTGGGQTAYRVLSGGGSPSPIGTTMQMGPPSGGPGNLTPAGIVADAKYVYWASLGTGQIVYCLTTGCSTGQPTPLATITSGGGSTGASLALDATYVYWVDRSAGVVARVVKPQ